MIVDTSFLLDIIDNTDAAVEKQEELESESVPLVVPPVTVLELYIGVGKVPNTRNERQRVEAALDPYPVVETTPSIARRAGRLLGERIADTDDSEGAGIGKADAAVAATALERDEPVLAGDRHFGTIPGVSHETYR
jgi:predicted nucleic acid-binding protein